MWLDDPDDAPSGREVLRSRGSCGKARFGSRHAAERSIKAMKTRGQHKPFLGRLAAYLCDDCRVWHVGHSKNQDGFR